MAMCGTYATDSSCDWCCRRCTYWGRWFFNDSCRRSHARRFGQTRRCGGCITCNRSIWWSWRWSPCSSIGRWVGICFTHFFSNNFFTLFSEFNLFVSFTFFFVYKIIYITFREYLIISKIKNNLLRNKPTRKWFTHNHTINIPLNFSDYLPHASFNYELGENK